VHIELPEESAQALERVRPRTQKKNGLTGL